MKKEVKMKIQISAILFISFICSPGSNADQACEAQAYREYQAALQSCGGGSGNEEWECETKVENRSGTIDISRCKGNNNIACYEDTKETCTEKNSGRVSIRKQTIFTGACVGSFSDCW